MMDHAPYKLTEIDHITWQANVETIIPDIMFSHEYVQVLASSFKFKLKYIVVKEKGVVNLACVVFFRKKKVLLADNYTYQPLWVNSKISERRQIGILTYFINYLKDNFTSIKFKLNPLLTDVRSFKWEGFNIEPRFTYLRHQNSEIHKQITDRIKKNTLESAQVSIKMPSVDDISVNIDFLKSLRFGDKKAHSYKTYLNGLAELGYLKAFTFTTENNIRCSYLLLVDFATKKAYTLMVNGADRQQKHLHSLLYKKIINWADDHGFETVDFCGANMKGISNFKSYFNPTLQLYYIVRYSYLQKAISVLTQIVNKF